MGKEERAFEILYSTDSREELGQRIAALEEMVSGMYRTMDRVLEHSTDTVWAGDCETLRDAMDAFMEDMAALGMPPEDYDERMRELGRAGMDEGE